MDKKYISAGKSTYGNLPVSVAAIVFLNQMLATQFFFLLLKKDYHNDDFNNNLYNAKKINKIEVLKVNSRLIREINFEYHNKGHCQNGWGIHCYSVSCRQQNPLCQSGFDEKSRTSHL